MTYISDQMKEDARRYEEQRKAFNFVDPLDDAIEEERMKSVDSTELSENDYIEDFISRGEQV